MEDSPAIQLLDLIWNYHGHKMAHSWRRLNQALWSGLRLATEAGLRFDPGDIEVIYSRRFRGGHWISDPEGFYQCAASPKRGPANLSASKAWEAYFGRKPLIYRGSRLAMGSRLEWGDEDREMLTVTSFTGEGLIACAYHDRKRSRVRRRVAITAAEFAADKRRWRSVKTYGDLKKVVADKPFRIRWEGGGSPEQYGSLKAALEEAGVEEIDPAISRMAHVEVEAG